MEILQFALYVKIKHNEWVFLTSTSLKLLRNLNQTIAQNLQLSFEQLARENFPRGILESDDEKLVQLGAKRESFSWNLINK